MRDTSAELEVREVREWRKLGYWPAPEERDDPHRRTRRHGVYYRRDQVIPHRRLIRDWIADALPRPTEADQAMIDAFARYTCPGSVLADYLEERHTTPDLSGLILLLRDPDLPEEAPTITHVCVEPIAYGEDREYEESESYREPPPDGDEEREQEWYRLACEHLAALLVERYPDAEIVSDPADAGLDEFDPDVLLDADEEESARAEAIQRADADMAAADAEQPTPCVVIDADYFEEPCGGDCAYCSPPDGGESRPCPACEAAKQSLVAMCQARWPYAAVVVRYRHEYPYTWPRVSEHDEGEVWEPDEDMYQGSW